MCVTLTGPLQRNLVQLVIWSPAKICAPWDDSIHGWGVATSLNLPSTCAIVSDKQAQRLPPKSIITWFLKRISCLWKHWNLISLHMSHLGSVHSIISVTQPGCVAYWQVLSARRQAGPSTAQKHSLLGQQFPSQIRYIRIACVHAHSVVSDSLWPHSLPPPMFLCPWNFPGKNTEKVYHFLHHGIFSTQGSNLHLSCLLALVGGFSTTELPGKPRTAWTPAKNTDARSPPQKSWIQILGRRIPGICILTSIQK